MNLPLLGHASRVLTGHPTMHTMRTRLGGAYEEPATAELGAAVLVGGKLGIVLATTRASTDIWIGNGLVHRTLSIHTVAYEGPLPADLATVAADMQRFAQLQPGTTVSYVEPTGEQRAGLLLEKCRFGALVAHHDGSIIALGFRRLRAQQSDWN